MSTASSDPIDHLRNLALPALNLGIIMTAYITRVTRSSMLNVLGEDYIRTARAKGVRRGRLVLRHGLRNALIPVVTVVGLYFGQIGRASSRARVCPYVDISVGAGSLKKK